MGYYCFLGTASAIGRLLERGGPLHLCQWVCPVPEQRTIKPSGVRGRQRGVNCIELVGSPFLVGLAGRLSWSPWLVAFYSRSH